MDVEVEDDSGNEDEDMAEIQDVHVADESYFTV